MKKRIFMKHYLNPQKQRGSQSPYLSFSNNPVRLDFPTNVPLF